MTAIMIIFGIVAVLAAGLVLAVLDAFDKPVSTSWDN